MPNHPPELKALLLKVNLSMVALGYSKPARVVVLEALVRGYKQRQETP